MAETSHFAHRPERWRLRGRPYPPNGKLVVRVRRLGRGVAVVSVVGEVDLANVASLRNEVLAAAADTRTRTLVCDLSGVRFLALSGVTVLLTAQSTMDERGGAMVVVADDPVVLRPLTVTGLLRTLSVRPDLPTALRHT